MNRRASRRAHPARHPDRAARVLYLSYDGMCDPLGTSQVLPYLQGLAKRGHSISLISFEKPERSIEERAAIQHLCAGSGIDWHPQRYHKRPAVLSSMFDVWQMRRIAERLHRDEPFDLAHCRSYLPSLVGLSMKRRHGVGFVFDMRGFWADERVDGGIWKLRNPLFRWIYRSFKRRETDFLTEADHIISLTKEGREVLLDRADRRADGPPITVIPCCVDFDLFGAVTQAQRSAARVEFGIGRSGNVLSYIGSLGGNYMLGEMLDFFRIYRERHRESRFLFITHTPEAEVRSSAARKGIADSDVIVRKATREQVPALMAAADLGIAFKQPNFSAKACSPTKLSEMLAVEIPIVTNGGVGDVELILSETRAGVVVERFNDDAYRAALDELAGLKPDMRRWRSAARRWFDLEAGIDRYDDVYRNILEAADPRDLAA